MKQIVRCTCLAFGLITIGLFGCAKKEDPLMAIAQERIPTVTATQVESEPYLSVAFDFRNEVDEYTIVGLYLDGELVSDSSSIELGHKEAGESETVLMKLNEGMDVPSGGVEWTMERKIKYTSGLATDGQCRGVTTE